MANLPTAVEDTHSSQCWECRRRRLVCDGTQPVCTKCRAARIVCPGYADKKPLTWLAPGQVLSRARNRKGARKGCSTKRDGASQNHKLPTPSSSDSGSENQTDELELLARDDPIPVELRPEVCDVFEAMMYCTFLWASPCFLFRQGSLLNKTTLSRQLPDLSRSYRPPTWTQSVSNTHDGYGEHPSRHCPYSRLDRDQPPDHPDGP